MRLNGNFLSRDDWIGLNGSRRGPRLSAGVLYTDEKKKKQKKKTKKTERKKKRRKERLLGSCGETGIADAP
ncbi:hypothetical protein Dda_4410 [Drechslerella dactyloides]|uniref:Uncharacterized protein n=1 Tax=Drechslerella dactyloides TaxID=74499 RepID=A0AAD6NHX2_DREDA|nr:hypothetical protein Dda_4410 [Drechslerella dactyloides]